jgi:hypothetical protein
MFRKQKEIAKKCSVQGGRRCSEMKIIASKEREDLLLITGC